MGVPMATTRIIPMHINKGKTIAQCMKARIDYVKNPDKRRKMENSFRLMPVHRNQQIRNLSWLGISIL